MKIFVLTLFPPLFDNFLSESIVGIALAEKKTEVYVRDLRDYSNNPKRQVDDYPYGGGAGMVLKPEPFFNAWDSLPVNSKKNVIYFTPQGRLLNQQIVKEYSQQDEIVIFCGHYKEIDHRVRQALVTDELSIGDYVVSGGELPAMILIDALCRLQEGVLNDINSAYEDSHEQKLLGCPHYTRPPDFRGLKVPEVLLSGNHKEINKWRLQQSIETTKSIRPELLTDEK
ncbi:MAG: tRNA (guanosine(37)-N1)-methyltransferase TrmD [Candidatus Cloacimonetes bacterium]|nr:tRNA (guanosine(37)-N1)-methyltransferase TrmD [Candidatus Cloacimonadota bacterium]